jgi:hypothetical protein
VSIFTNLRKCWLQSNCLERLIFWAKNDKMIRELIKNHLPIIWWRWLKRI